MSPPDVDALLFRLGPHRLAVELHLVSSVLTDDDAQGMHTLDPRPFLGLRLDSHDHLAVSDPLVGLLTLDGPPTVLFLGEVLGAETLGPSDLLEVSPFLNGGLPSILRPICAEIDQKVVWLLDLDTLTTATIP